MNRHRGMPLKKGKYVCIFLAIGVWIAFILSNSLKNAAESGRQSARVLRLLLPLIAKLNIAADAGLMTHLVRKTAHVLEFLVLAVLVSLLFLRKKPRVMIPCVLIAGLVIASADECIQYYVDGRAAMAADVLIDLSGAALGLLLGLLFRRKKRNPVPIDINKS